MKNLYLALMCLALLVVNTHAAAPVATVKTVKAAKNAESVLFTILKLFSEGQITEIANHVDDKMIGYTQFFEAINQASNKKKDIKISSKEKRTTKGKDIFIIQLEWEQRYLELPGLAPKLVKGKTLFLFQLIDKNWKLTSQSGDNIFAL